MVNFFRKYHKWFSLFATIFIFFFAVSGIILNHREMLSQVDINRKLLPPGYRYNNWNLAAVKGAVKAGGDSILVYGNTGLWLTDSTFKTFHDLNAGFPEGIDNRKINTLSWSPASGLYAGTLFGLYHFHGGVWVKTALPVDVTRVVKVLQVDDRLLVMTRSNLYVATGASRYHDFSEIPVPKGEDSDGKVGLFKTLWVIHSGEIYGFAGKLIVDCVGIVFIILCITGLICFFVPSRLKRLKDSIRRSRLKRLNRTSLKLHNVLGSWAIIILLVNTTTGIFLRPPLLIPIAGERVAKLKYTELDNPNPWFDRFRDLLYDKEQGRYLVATSEGVYYSDDKFSSDLKIFPVQPPVSVMGINVFEKTGPGHYLVGSFSGIFDWEPATGRTIDCITRTGYVDTGQGGPPFGNVTVAGYIRCSNAASVIFDYAHGAFALEGKNPFPPVPSSVIAASPMSLWNTSLEIHTGRIFEPILGPFYILVVPLVGLATLFILVSGFLAWWLAKRRTAKRQAILNS
ncbi:MAG: PepSY-associated TM helix domain-containing protein [Bacteroidetes bacterium]|nr:PepSY-associated TM helix domain-containing protein [Bacteroidota bacterium]